MDIMKTSDKVNLTDNKSYEIIGSLVYIMVAIRPDISYTVTKVVQRPRESKFFSFNESKTSYVI